jgi:hypothetical protein
MKRRWKTKTPMKSRMKRSVRRLVAPRRIVQGAADADAAAEDVAVAVKAAKVAKPRPRLPKVGVR